ncbi:MAG: 30S ribosome-binding factor RbfA [Firmicutes bacterium]|jgi:ribosome-binding factor A|nr:30S ribosome-binding factor RbfA [Bacillota bacterium]
MNQARAERVAQLMQRELGQMLLTEVKDPRIGFVSITRVEVSRDLSQARIYVSVMGTREEKEASFTGLKQAAHFLRGEVARRLGLRRAPEMVFREDTGIQESLNIQELIRQVSQQQDEPHD